MWDSVIKFISSDIGVFISFICSVIGFLITISILIITKNIKNNFLRRARLPEVIKELSKENKSFMESLRDWNDNNNNERQKCLKVMVAIIDNIQPKLPKDEKAKCKKMSKEINKINKLNKDLAWNIYGELSGFIVSLQQLQKDKNWD